MEEGRVVICGTKAVTGLRPLECTKRPNHNGPHQQEWSDAVWSESNQSILVGRVNHTASWMETGLEHPDRVEPRKVVGGYQGSAPRRLPTPPSGPVPDAAEKARAS